MAHDNLVGDIRWGNSVIFSPNCPTKYPIFTEMLLAIEFITKLHLAIVFFFIEMSLSIVFFTEISVKMGQSGYFGDSHLITNINKYLVI